MKKETMANGFWAGTWAGAQHGTRWTDSAERTDGWGMSPSRCRVVCRGRLAPVCLGAPGSTPLRGPPGGLVAAAGGSGCGCLTHVDYYPEAADSQRHASRHW